MEQHPLAVPCSKRGWLKIGAARNTIRAKREATVARPTKPSRKKSERGTRVGYRLYIFKPQRARREKAPKSTALKKKKPHEPPESHQPREIQAELEATLAAQTNTKQKRNTKPHALRREHVKGKTSAALRKHEITRKPHCT